MNVITVQGEYEKNQGFHYEYDRDSLPLEKVVWGVFSRAMS